MRSALFSLALLLAACGGNDGGFKPSPQTPQTTQHAPEISNLKLSPDTAKYMEGDGSVQITAELSFTDSGRDIETLHVRMPGDTSLVIPISELANSASGALREAFDVTTTDAEEYTIEIWLVDQAGQSSNHLFAGFSVIRHAPEISIVTLSPESTVYMEGGGSVVVAAEITFTDSGRDLKTLWLRMPDGATMEFDEPIAMEGGTITESFAMSTETVGVYTVEFWLMDKAGDHSIHVTADFNVVGHMQSGDWTSRLVGLPYALNDVIWDGSVFVAVGDGGAILTSPDGVDWLTRESTTDVNLNSIAAYGSEIFAVGNETVLLSTDNGESWRMKDKHFYAVDLTAVAVTSSRVVVSGFSYGLAAGITSTSEDRGDTWQFADTWFAADLTYSNGLYVGALVPYLGQDRVWVMVSSDGESWNEIVLREGEGALFTVIHDGSQFIVAGGDGAAYTSFDGVNWTQLQTPVVGVSYLSAAWNGSKLVLAGSSDSPSEHPIGIASSDGGVSWDIFNIDDSYESRGMTYGNGRFVSVGQSRPGSGEGAIYTAE